MIGELLLFMTFCVDNEHKLSVMSGCLVLEIALVGVESLRYWNKVESEVHTKVDSKH